MEPDAATAELFRSLLPEQAANAPVPAERRDISAKTPRLEPVPATRGHLSTAAEDGEQSAIFSGRAGIPRITILPPRRRRPGSSPSARGLAHRGCDDRSLPLRSRSQSSLRTRLGVRAEAARRRSFAISTSTMSIETQLQNRGGEPWLAVKLVDAVNREILWVEQYAFNRETIARQYRELSVRIVLAPRRHDRADRARTLRCRARPDRLPPVPDRAAALAHARPSKRQQGAPRIQVGDQQLPGFRAGDQRPSADLPHRVAADGAR